MAINLYEASLHFTAQHNSNCMASDDQHQFGSIILDSKYRKKEDLMMVRIKYQ